MIKKYKDFVPKIHQTCFVAENSTIVGNVEIGNNSSVWYSAVIRGDIEKISIGDNSNIQDGCVLHCAKGIELSIGNGVTVGHDAVLHSCFIDNDSLIGMGAIVLDGAKIGKNCLVGAGAVVTPNTEFPDGSLVLGSPAKVKRSLDADEIRNIKENSNEYIKFAKEYKKEE